MSKMPVLTGNLTLEQAGNINEFDGLPRDEFNVLPVVHMSLEVAIARGITRDEYYRLPRDIHGNVADFTFDREPIIRKAR